MKKKLPKNSTNLRHQISTILIWSPNGIILIVVSRDGGNPLLALSFNARSKLGRVSTFNQTNDAMDFSI